MKEVVQVLLSSYNGERYIREQLDSILLQEKVQVELLIRDDGSTDGTKRILQEYENKYGNIKVFYEDNIGVINSFFELIGKADGEKVYIAFADQDDVWLPEKLFRAVSMLTQEKETGKASAPLVYCSAKQLVDVELKPLPEALHYPKIRTEFGNALVENMCTGCTCVINQEMLCLLKGKKPEFTVMHDFWVYLLGTCFGRVVYDEECYILYRQHGSNELGAASSIWENYRRRIKKFKKHRGQLTHQAKELLRLYGYEMSEEKRELAEELIQSKESLRIRRRLFKSMKVFRQRKSDDWIMRMVMLAGWL